MSSNKNERHIDHLGHRTSYDYASKLVKDAIEHGGCTLNTMAYQANIPNYGYVVGGASNTLTIPVKEFKHNHFHALGRVTQWLDEHIESDGLPPYPFVGSWVDDDLVYFDFCNILYLLSDSLNLARYRGEKAIYDQASGESIYL